MAGVGRWWWRTGLLLAVAGAPKALAQVEAVSQAGSPERDTIVALGPFAGGGSMTGGGVVRNSSGFAVSVDRSFPLVRGLTIGPRFEIANGFVSVRDSDADSTRISTYDNRIFAAGLRLAHPVGNAGTFAREVYAAVTAGRGYSKLAIDETTDAAYRQHLFGGISGNHFGAELGAWVPLKGNFGLNLAFNASRYEADQSGLSGTWKGDGIGPDGTYSLTSGSHAPDDGAIPGKVTMRTYAAKVALVLGL